MGPSRPHRVSQGDVDRLIEHYKSQLNIQVYGAYELSSGSPFNWTEVLTKFVASMIDLLGEQVDDIRSRQSVVHDTMAFYAQAVEPALAAQINHPLGFKTVVEPIINKALPGLVGGLYDALVKIMRRPASAQPGFRPY